MANALLYRLRDYLRFCAHTQAEQIPVPPFTVFLHPAEEISDDDHAIPHIPVDSDLRTSLIRLRGKFEAKSRRMRVRFIEELAPGLAHALRAAGMVEERSIELLACTSSCLTAPPDVPYLTMVTLHDASALAEVRDGLDANERGFDPLAEPATDAQAQQFREGLIESRAFVAYIKGEIAGAGMFNPPHAGVTELVGIATLESFRRRGVASYLTAYAARVAFERGVELVYLQTDDAVARRVYRRLGFLPFGSLLTYADPSGNDRL